MSIQKNKVYLAELDTANGSDGSWFVIAIIANSDLKAEKIARKHKARIMAMHDGDASYKIVRS